LNLQNTINSIKVLLLYFLPTGLFFNKISFKKDIEYNIPRFLPQLLCTFLTQQDLSQFFLDWNSVDLGVSPGSITR
jgi:hypothetical protein